MKFCSIVSLALTGWYLVTPPITTNSKLGMYVDYQMPTTEWTIIEKYDNQENSLKVQRDYRSLEEKAKESGKRGDLESQQLWWQAFSSARCVAIDDSRVFKIR